MARKKLQRILESTALPNIINHSDYQAKENIQNFLQDAKKVYLELGCGRGDYTTGLSQLYPDAKCIGVDVQGERIWYGAKQAMEEKNENILFLRVQIGNILEYIPEHSIDEIWIPFPDPFPRKKTTKKRLVSPRFLEMYKVLLKKDGKVNFKTDNESLFLYGKEVLTDLGIKPLIVIDDVYKKEVNSSSPLFIQTTYEKKYLAQGKKIFYIAFHLS